jgi:NADH pyrophosphatase NudC (nudix superfamily)
MPDFELHRWFTADELKPCPVCGAQTAITTPRSGAFVCFECGEIRFPDTEPHAHEETPPNA